MASPRLSPLIAFRAFGPSMLVVDHRRDEIFELDGAVAPLFAKLERGERIRSAVDRAHLEALAEIGLLEGPTAGADEGALAASEPDAKRASEPAAAHADLLEELNRRAADALIPLHAQLELTHRCALDCDYCYLAPRRAGAEPELSTREVTDLLDQLAAAGGLFLLLTGGEPLLRPDLEAIVEQARARRFAVSILTSGYRMDPALAGRLARRGLDSVQVTVHDADAERHDARTTVRGSFEAAVGAISTWRSLGVRTQMAVTVTRLSQDRLGALAALARRLDVAVNLSCTVLPRRDGSRLPQRLCTDEAGLRAAYETFPSAVPARLSTLGPDDRPCGAGAAAIAFDAVGTVYPCHALHLPLGSIRRSSLAAIWTGSAELRALRALRLRDLRDCPSCELRGFCNRCAGFAVDEGLAVTDHSGQDCTQARVRARMHAENAPGARPGSSER